MERFRYSDDKAVFFQLDNYDISEGCGKAVPDVRQLVVWGGSVLNCAEGSLSELVNRNKNILQSLTYFPLTTKGGALIRPTYHEGYRQGEVMFPNLTQMIIPAKVGCPKGWGYITPKLEHLTVLFDQKDDHDFTKILPWIDWRQKPKSLLYDCPELVDIIVASGCHKDSECVIVSWFLVLPPIIIPWDVQRLLWISQKEDTKSCPMARVPRVIIQLILEFLQRKWTVIPIHTLPPDILIKYSNWIV